MSPRREANGHRGSGRNKSPTYYSWACMRNRCLNPRDSFAYLYGARGITCCERWAKFANFLADMGERPYGKSLDRIDPEKGYEPGNCKWSTPKEQAQGIRRTPALLKSWENFRNRSWKNTTTS